VGDAIASKIVEYFETGSIEELEALRSEPPADIGALTAVEGVGPKTVGSLYEALGITTLDELEAAAEAEQIREVSGFGAKTEENILDNIPFAREARKRTRLGDARPVADAALSSYLDDLDAVASVEVCGSIRRWKDTIGDIDLLVVASDAREPIVEAFTEWPEADATIEAGTGKASVRASGTRVDLRIVDGEEFGAALQYFTGSRAHNVAVRKPRDRPRPEAQRVRPLRHLDVDDPDAGQRGRERVAGETEDGVYEALDMDPVPPELRENNGEVAAAAAGELPNLVETKDLRGDLHTPTDWSDGGFSIAEMIEAGGRGRGYDAHAVTDHAARPGIFGNTGLDEAEIAAQADAVADAIDAVDGAVWAGEGGAGESGAGEPTDADTSRCSTGSRPTSTRRERSPPTTTPSPTSISSSPRRTPRWDRDPDAATERLIRAVEHPYVDILGHPTGRIINSRPGIAPDVAAVVEAAAAAGTAIEVNANPARLDADGDMVRAAIDAGATIAVNTDAHAPRELDNARYGVHTARRGWAETADVLNARSPTRSGRSSTADADRRPRGRR